MSEKDSPRPAVRGTESTQDHLDHLRKSHFFLVTTAGALMIAALGHQENRRLIAAEDARQILANVPRFDSVRVDTMIEHAMLAGAPERLFVTPTSNTGRNPGRAEIRDTIRYVVTLDPRRPARWTDASLPRGMRVSAAPVAAPKPIRTLQDWRALWESLGYSRICRIRRARMFDGQILSSTRSIPVSVTREPAWLHNMARTEQLRGHYVISHPPGTDGYELMVLAYADTLPPDTTPFAAVAGRHPLLVALSCGRGTSYLQAQQIASLLAEKQWAPGRFQESFPDLAAFTDGLNHASLRSIAEVLQKEVGSGARDVEVVGLPLPIGMLIEGGLLLVLTLQLYFLLHLRALQRLPPRGHPIAWIGLYDDPFSWLVYSVSIVVLPVACASILVYKALGRDSRLTAAVYLVELGLIVALSVALLLHHPRRGRRARYRRFFLKLWRETWVRADPAPRPAGAAAPAAPPPTAGAPP